MAKCIYHPKAVVANSGICPRCKACKHTSWFRKEGEEIYQCNGCFRTSRNPDGERWLLTKEGWKEEE